LTQTPLLQQTAAAVLYETEAGYRNLQQLASELTTRIRISEEAVKLFPLSLFHKASRTLPTFEDAESQDEVIAERPASNSGCKGLNFDSETGYPEIVVVFLSHFR
jgi:hypothetical protein